jgi:nucleoid DNA-binding protein
MTMTKADLARAVYERHGGMSLQDAQHIIDLIFAIIKQQLLGGNRVHIVGFGTLEGVKRRARRGRNPSTGETIELPAKRTLVFRPSRAIKSV